MTTFLIEATTDSTIARESEETKEVQWIGESKLREKLDKNPGDFFSLQVPAWQYHFKRNL